MKKQEKERANQTSEVLPFVTVSIKKLSPHKKWEFFSCSFVLGIKKINLCNYALVQVLVTYVFVSKVLAVAGFLRSDAFS